MRTCISSCIVTGGLSPSIVLFCIRCHNFRSRNSAKSVPQTRFLHQTSNTNFAGSLSQQRRSARAQCWCPVTSGYGSRLPVWRVFFFLFNIFTEKSCFLLKMSIRRLLAQHFVALLLAVLVLAAQIDGLGEVIWAVNCGGEAHVDIHGIRYQKDPLVIGTPSDYGKSLLIQRVVPQDQILYQTERYHTESFGYEIPVRQDGEYVLVLQFSEVWFTAPNQKVCW